MRDTLAALAINDEKMKIWWQLNSAISEIPEMAGDEHIWNGFSTQVKALSGIPPGERLQ
jgi:hypothetical protein